MGADHNVKKIFKKILLINSILFFMVIVISVTFSANSVYNTMVREMLKTNSTILDLTKQNVDLQLINLEEHINNYVKNEMAQDYVASSNPDSMLLVENRDLLSQIGSTNSKVAGTYVYKFSTEKVLSQAGLTAAKEIFDDDFLEQLRNLEHDRWLGIRLQGHGDAAKSGVITYARKFPGGRAAFVLDINESLLFDTISKYKDTENGTFFICDGDAVILSHIDKTNLMKSELETPFMQRIKEGDKSIGTFTGTYQNLKSKVSFNRSSHTGWYYINVIPNRNFLQPLAGSITAIAITALLLYLLSILLAYVFIKITSKPIGTFVHSVANSIVTNHSKNSIEESFGNLEEIENLFTNMIYEQKELEGRLKGSYESIKWRVIMDLVLGFSKDTDKVQSALELVQTPLYPENFMVLIFEVCNKNELRDKNKTDELNLICASVKLEFERLMNAEAKGCAVNNADGNVIAIISFDNADEGNNTIITLSIAESIMEFGQKYFNVDSWVGIGSMVRAMEDISTSYSEAVYAMKYKLVSGSGGILFIDDFDTDQQVSWRETLEKMESVVSKLCEYTDSELQESISKIVANICEKRPTADTVQQLALHFIMLVTARYPAFSKQADCSHSFADAQTLLEKCADAAQINEILYNTLRDMKHIIAASNAEAEKYSSLVHKITAYIDKNYTDSELSLNMLAEKFNISAPHLSRIFKESTSQRFMDYLIDKRMGKAKELLSTTNMKIAAVAAAVGYDNQASFMRIFKKYTGATPTSWKKNSVEL